MEQVIIPLEQFIQKRPPLPIWYVPIGQAVHEFCPVLSWYVPGAHFLQVAQPDLLYLPAEQGWHTELEVLPVFGL